MKTPKTSQQLEIERYEREARKWARMKARWSAYKADKINPKKIVKIDFSKRTVVDLPTK